MKKKEAMNYIRERKGYIPYVALFEIYSDDDEIPQMLIDLECSEDKQREQYVMCGALGAEAFISAMKSFNENTK